MRPFCRFRGRGCPIKRIGAVGEYGRQVTESAPPRSWPGRQADDRFRPRSARAFRPTCRPYSPTASYALDRTPPASNRHKGRMAAFYAHAAFLPSRHRGAPYGIQIRVRLVSTFGVFLCARILSPQSQCSSLSPHRLPSGIYRVPILWAL